MSAKAFNNPKVCYPHTLKSSREERTLSSMTHAGGSREKPGRSRFCSCTALHVGGTHCLDSMGREPVPVTGKEEPCE